MLCRVLLERLDKTVSTALIFNSYLTKMELLQAITDDFGLQPREPTSKGYIDALNEYLLSEFAAGRNAVVVIDEAQNLEPTVLEQLRMLSNLETERVKLFEVESRLLSAFHGKPISLRAGVVLPKSFATEKDRTMAAESVRSMTPRLTACPIHTSDRQTDIHLANRSAESARRRALR